MEYFFGWVSGRTHVCYIIFYAVPQQIFMDPGLTVLGHVVYDFFLIIRFFIKTQPHEVLGTFFSFFFFGRVHISEPLVFEETLVYTV